MQEFLNRVINGDCSEIMGFMHSECVDLTVTSPPYDNLRDYNGYSFPFEKIAKELYRVTKPGGVVVWIVADATVDGSETGTSFKQALYFKEVGFNLHDTMVWDKENCRFPSPVRYHNSFEYMFIFSKGKPKTVNLIHDRKNKWGGTQVHGTNRMPNGETKRLVGHNKKLVKEFGARFNVWRIANAGKKDNPHPATFPEQLAQDHILSWSNEGDIVFDPMCGSGTTLKMAYANNRNFIGIDYSNEYVELSQKRLKL